MIIHALAGAALTLCVASSRVVDAQTVRDSADVRVVHYDRSAVPRERWTLDLTPLVEIGGADAPDPSSEFAQIRGVVRFEDGRIAVANGATNEIRVLSPNGALAASYSPLASARCAIARRSAALEVGV